MPKEHYRINERFDDQKMDRLVSALNRSFAKLERRLDSSEKVNASTPPTVKEFTAEGKQGAFVLAWKKLHNIDGYTVLVASDSGMLKVTNRFDIPGQEVCTHSFSVGNVSMTRYFQIYSYIGSKHSQGSVVQSATTSTYGASEAAPSAPPFDPGRPGIRNAS